MKKLMIYFGALVIIVLCIMHITKICALEKSDEKNFIPNKIDQKYIRFTTTDKMLIYFTIITPEVVKQRIDASYINANKLDHGDRDNLINDEIKTLELEKGICVTIALLNKNWSNYKPDISGIAERIFIENDKGNLYPYQKIIRNISNSILEENQVLTLSFPRKILNKENKNIFIAIRGIDKNSAKEHEIKVQFSQDILSYLTK